MNPNTGELRLLRRDELAPAGFEVLPDEHQQLARLKMKAMAFEEFRPPEPVHVNLRSGSPLAEWARKKRKAKIAAQSRRRNRK